MPVTTNYFDPVTSGTNQITKVNTALGQLDYQITQLFSTTGGTIEVEAGESLAVNDAAYVDPDDGLLYAIDADAAPAVAGTIRGVVQNAVSITQTATLIVTGVVSGFTGLTAWLPVYADETGAGTLTQIRPKPDLDSGQVAIVPMGMAISATEIDVLPRYMDNRIRYQSRYSPAQNDTVTVQHASNPNGFARVVRAYITGDNTLTEYGSANQDTDVNILGQVPATYTTDQCSGGTPLGNMTDIDGLAGGFDNDASTRAQRTSATSGQIGYDFGASNDKTIRRYTLQESTSSASAAMFNTWTLEYSSNGSDWTVIDTVSGETSWSDGEKRTFDVDIAVSARYWRVNCSVNDGGASTAVGEVEMMEAATFTDGPDKLAQGFQLSAAGSVKTVSLWLKKVGSPTGNLTVKIQTDSAGDPSGTTVTNGTSGTVAASSLSSSYGWIEFTFSTEPDLTGSTQYHIVLETSDSLSTDYVDWGADGSTPGYSNGEMKSEASSTWSSESADAIFQVSAEGLQYLEPVLVDEYASSFASMGAQAGDTGGSDVDAKTTFKCLAAAGYADITCEVVI